MNAALLLLALWSPAVATQSIAPATDLQPIVEAAQACFAVADSTASSDSIITSQGWVKSKTIKSSGYWHYAKTTPGLNLGLFKAPASSRSCAVFVDSISTAGALELMARIRDISKPTEFYNSADQVTFVSATRRVSVIVQPESAGKPDSMSVMISVDPAGTSKP